MKPLPLLVLAMLVAAVSAEPAEMGKVYDFNLTSEGSMTFKSTRPLKPDEVLKIQLHPTGAAGHRPAAAAPVWLMAGARDPEHTWVLPWSPGGGPPYEWVEALLCRNNESLTLLAATNASVTIPLRWSVRQENADLGSIGTFKVTPPHVTYRHYRWSSHVAVAVDVRAECVKGQAVCASLVVARRCATHPRQLAAADVLQHLHFSESIALSVRRADAPDGFWLYLLSEPNNLLCPSTAGRGRDSLPPPAKTVHVAVKSRNFLDYGLVS